MDIVFFADMAIEYHNPEPKMKVRGLSERGHRVILVDKLGINDPSLQNLGLVVRRLAPPLFRARGEPGWTSRLEEVAAVPGSPPGTAGPVGVVRPGLLPPRRAPVIRSLNRVWLRRKLIQVMRAASMAAPVFWVRFPVPELVDIVDRLPVRGVVYECVDDFPAFVHWTPAIRRLLEMTERRLTARADLVVTTSPVLARRLEAWAAPVHVVTNGVDMRVFTEEAMRKPLPCSLGDLPPGPVVGYLGGLDLRLDYAVLDAVAKVLDGVGTLVVAGPRLAGISLGDLPTRRNVRLVGAIPHDQVPACLARFDVCLLPYRTDLELAQALSPVKLFEYLACGRPVVAADIPAVRESAGLVYVAADQTDFPRLVMVALSENDPHLVRARQDRARAEGWVAKLDRLDALLRARFPAGR
ncbi:MAG: hypothetical protein Kow00122_18560 [Thermoleophilia bacterium]